MALLALCSVYPSAAQADGIVVKGRIEGIKKGRLHLLTRSSESETDTIGTCDFKRGRFALKAVAPEPVVAQLVVEGYTGGFALFAEPGVTYEARLSQGDDYYIKGGALNDSYNSHMRVSDSLHIIISGLQERYDALRTAKKFRSASLVNDTLKREQEKLRTLTQQYLADNDNLIAAYTIYSNIVLRDANLGETRRLYATLGEGAKATQYLSLIHI